MKLPDEINYAEAYLTLRCNLRCPYCINDPDDKVVRNRKEMSGEEWIEMLNKIDFGNVPLTLGGGEPTIHKDFYQIVNGINPLTKLDLLTNLRFNPIDFKHNIPRTKFARVENPVYKAIRVSYHPSQMNPDELIYKARQMQLFGFPIGIFGINHPENIEANMQMAELARKEKIYFFVKDFLGEYKGKLFGNYSNPDGISGAKKQVKCRSKELLIGPEGDVYRCHRDLYRKENTIGRIPYVDLYKFRDCNNFGECNPCDLKLKTNRFLQAGNCQVEIEEIK